MGWIKAINRLPPDGTTHAARQKDDYKEIRMSSDGLIIAVKGVIMPSIEILEEWFPGLEWLDESEPLYTEKDVLGFAKFCGIQFQYINGFWRDDPDPAKWTTEALLELYKKTRIPPLPKIV